MTPPTTRTADLVLEGGGVKGIALVGAATALDEAGWTFARVAGSSAGALVGAIIAAMQQAGEPMTRVDEIMRTLDYRQMLDRRAVAKALRWWPLAANGWGLMFHLGMYRGHYMTAVGARGARRPRRAHLRRLRVRRPRVRARARAVVPAAGHRERPQPAAA